MVYKREGGILIVLIGCLELNLVVLQIRLIQGYKLI